MLKWDQVVGNPAVVKLLRRHPIPPSALFVGPEGVGKKTIALTAAARGQCRGSEQDAPCGTCPPCVRAAAGNHPDIRLYQPDGLNIKIEAIRELNREAQYRPFEGKRRFFIVDQAERMTEAAANSLLKTLEEPAESSCIVLVTSIPERLLPTIRSRCQMVRFSGISRQELIDHLEGAFDPSEARLRAAMSRGSLGAALSLDLEQLSKDADLLSEFLDDWCRRPSFEALFDWCESAPLRGDVKKRDRVQALLERLQALAEDLYYLLAGTPERLTHIDLRDRLEPVATRVSLNWVTEFLYHVAQARSEADRYINPLMCFERPWYQSWESTLECCKS